MLALLTPLERPPEEVTVRGREYIGWELRRGGGEPLTAHTDTLTLSFKTRHPAGLLFFTGQDRHESMAG